MKRRTHLAVWSAVTAISLCVSALPASAQDDKNTASSKAGTFTSTQTDSTLAHVERANKIVGKEIKSSENQRVGKLETLVRRYDQAAALARHRRARLHALDELARHRP